MPSTFNVLKDSVRGIKDKVERDKDLKKKELDFFKELDKIKD